MRDQGFRIRDSRGNFWSSFPEYRDHASRTRLRHPLAQIHPRSGRRGDPDAGPGDWDQRGDGWPGGPRAPEPAGAGDRSGSHRDACVRARRRPDDGHLVCDLRRRPRQRARLLRRRGVAAQFHHGDHRRRPDPRRRDDGVGQLLRRARREGAPRTSGAARRRPGGGGAGRGAQSCVLEVGIRRRSRRARPPRQHRGPGVHHLGGDGASVQRPFSGERGHVGPVRGRDAAVARMGPAAVSPRGGGRREACARRDQGGRGHAGERRNRHPRRPGAARRRRDLERRSARGLLVDRRVGPGPRHRPRQRRHAAAGAGVASAERVRDPGRAGGQPRPPAPAGRHRSWGGLDRRYRCFAGAGVVGGRRGPPGAAPRRRGR